MKCYLHLPAAGGTVPGWKAVEHSCSRDALFKTTSFFLWPREKTLAELKQQVATLKSSIAKEEERVADLKLKTDDQAHPEIKARGITCVLNGSSPPASSILGKKVDRGCTGGTSAAPQQWRYSKGRFGVRPRQQIGINVPSPCSCYVVGIVLAETTGHLQHVSGHSKAG